MPGKAGSGLTGSNFFVGGGEGGAFGEEDAEDGALHAVLLGPDAAAVLLDDGAADGEAEAGAAFLAGIGGVDLLEAIGDGLELVGGNAAALVDDAEGNAFGGAGDDDAHDGFRRGEFDRVAEQVGDDLLEAVGVGFEGGGDTVADERDLVGFGDRLHGFDDLTGQVFQIDGAEGERGASGLHALEVEDVVDEADEAVGVGNGDAQQGGGLVADRAEHAGGEQAEGAADRG